MSKTTRRTPARRQYTQAEARRMAQTISRLQGMLEDGHTIVASHFHGDEIHFFAIKGNSNG